MSKKIKFLFGNQTTLETNNNNNKEDGALYFAKYKTEDIASETDSNTFINLYYSDGEKRLSVDPIVNYTSTTWDNIDFWTSASEINK